MRMTGRIQLTDIHELLELSATLKKAGYSMGLKVKSLANQTELTIIKDSNGNGGVKNG